MISNDTYWCPGPIRWVIYQEKQELILNNKKAHKMDIRLLNSLIFLDDLVVLLLPQNNR